MTAPAETVDRAQHDVSEGDRLSWDARDFGPEYWASEDAVLVATSLVSAGPPDGRL